MPANTFTLGQLVKMSATFVQNSTALNPGTVTLIIEEPSPSTGLVITSPSTLFANSTTGTFSYEYDADTAGTIEYRWKSASPQGAKENYFIVEQSRVPNP